jgi:carboxyl-terminal processing protease
VRQYRDRCSKSGPPDEKDDRALNEALDLVRGTITDATFPPNPKAAVP